MIQEPVYKTAETAEMFNVRPDTVRKWIACDVIPRGQWFRLPGGNIRIRESIIRKLKNVKEDL